MAPEQNIEALKFKSSFPHVKVILIATFNPKS
jgi:hypothetical protein